MTKSVVRYKGRSYPRAGGRGPCPKGYRKTRYGCRPIRPVSGTPVEDTSRTRLRQSGQLEEGATTSRGSWVTAGVGLAMASAILAARYALTQRFPQQITKQFKPQIPKGAMVASPRSPVAPKGTGKYSYRPRFGGRAFGTPKVRGAAYRAYKGQRY